MSALKRNSTSSWDSVAMEMQRCASAADARFTPSGCRRQALVLHRWRRELWTPRTLPPLQLMSGWRSCATRCGEHGLGQGRGAFRTKSRAQGASWSRIPPLLYDCV
jgi:hypothetical protein